MSRRQSVDFHAKEEDEDLLVECAEGGYDIEALKRYARIGEAVCGIAEKGDDAEVRRKGDGSNGSRQKTVREGTSA